MRSRRSAWRCRIVLLAAARLAGLYALGTAVLLLLSFIALEGPPQAREGFTKFAAPVAFAFALAFILLAVARRVGLVALWLTLGTLWGVSFRDIVVNPMDSAAAFVAWSNLAIPLAFLGGLGVRTTLRIGLGRSKPAVLTVTVALWVALLVPTLAMSILHNRWLDFWYHSVEYRIPKDFPRLIWAVGPPIISALSIAHVWVGTALPKVEALSNRDDG